MKAPLSWLKDYVDIDVSAEELEEKLFSCGLEVEETIYVGKDIEKVVAARIVDARKHPDADKLTVCRVDAGKYGQLQIITGAKNIAVGDLVPVALDGARLAGGKTIAAGELRGLPSLGMMCSGAELGIGDDVYEGADADGILILREDVPCGTDIREVVGLNDVVFDIGVTANRPDCQSIYGLAREVAAVLKKPLRPLAVDFRAEKGFSSKGDIDIRVESPDLCPRYMAHRVSDVKIGKSPAWLRRRLASVGLRSVSNMVDITNFVLMEVGQPMHAFDVSALQGHSVVVRRAAAGENIVTLDGKSFTLGSDNLVICDGQKPVALAGIMGGKESGISEGTREVLFESAKFARDNVRKTSRTLGQRSDSSARFEKGVDAYTSEVALNRALHLVSELGCGKIACDRFDLNAEDMTPRVIFTSVSRINGLLGIEVPAAAIVSILERLHFEVALDGDDLRVTVPLYREDVEGYPDLAEEVIRMYGYDNVKSTLMEKARITNGGKTPEQRDADKLKQTLCAAGLDEIVTYSFVSEKDFDVFGLDKNSPEHRFIRLVNPLGEDLSVMRTTLVPSMTAVLAKNLSRKNAEAALFEFARVYHPAGEVADEKNTLCLGMYGAHGGFFDMKGAIEAIADGFCLTFEYAAGGPAYMHPARTATLSVGGTTVGYFGELHPEIAEKYGIEKRVCVGEIDYDALKTRFGGKFVYRAIPRYPSVERDLALVMDEKTACASVERVIRESGSSYLTALRLFDVYTGEGVPAGKKSLAFSLTFTATDRTLGLEEVDAFVAEILSALRERLDVRLR